ncbi:eukaryotic translation initiation factor 3 subunit H-like, partial [Ostrinia furnacalis]|uniref:eukaryotic translation initiation factor 3 subunit H-like n=1 Tax=Ostrinia furnacalis TaxID=93504 RepID=UPI00103ACA9E
MANRAGGSARRVPETEAAITYVQCDGLAVMKIVKHCHEESCSNMEVAQGALLGLVVENRLEITNCFPFPKHDDTMDEEEYQLDMMRRLRRVNVDHFHVGWLVLVFYATTNTVSLKCFFCPLKLQKLVIMFVLLILVK